MSPAQTARGLAGGCFILILFIATGCATQTSRILQTAPALPHPIELADTPFFPQEQYQCGPAALATVLNTTGLVLAPEDLAPQVYLPERQGSLQLELLAAARRHGRVPYVLRPQLESVFAEVVAGHPVLVLQNLGLAWLPRWHYAVVIGFDLPHNEIILRSGRTARHIIAIDTFEHTWKRADYWAVVVTAPEQLPETAEETPYLQSVIALERLQRWDQTAKAYTAALKRWPKNQTAQLGLGNSRHALGDLAGAEAAFRRATRDHPDSAAAFNNLAQTLAERGRLCEAETMAKRAVALGGPLAETAQQTLEAIRARIAPTSGK
jgi:tetratricopeptide (TPR) repeat protein